MQKANTANIPTILAILGATGDLTAKKIVPSLHHIFRHRHLPTMFRVVGFSRQNLSDESFRGRVREAVERHHAGTGRTPPKLDEFLGLFSYTQGDFTNVRGFGDLKEALDAVDREWGVCTNKLFYLAAPPQFYEAIFKNLAASRLTEPCSPEEGWTRVIVEKPFGKDLKTAEALDELLGKLFREVQIYRIDHYLGKEMVQNMITFRFANNLFERDWGRDLIERIDVRILEKIGVEERGDFYDGVGALRDVGQNHLLQMLALVTMAHPVDFRSDAIRARREEILKSLRVFSKEETQVRTFRGQYEGYRAAEGVSPQSTTETYFKIRAELETPRWQGVPVILEGGKCMDQDAKEVVVTFRHPAPCLCPPDAKEHLKNRLVIHLSGREGITVQFWSKKPGITMDLEERSLDFFFKGADEDRPYAEAYEKLLVDCIRGDQTLFVSGGEVNAMWKFIDPIVAAWRENAVPLVGYRPGAKTIRKDACVVERRAPVTHTAERKIGIVGLGKMGGNIARRLLGKGWRVVGLDRAPEVTRGLMGEGVEGASSLEELVQKLSHPRVVWLMVPASGPRKGAAGGDALSPVDQVLAELARLLKKGDTVIDGGNSFYEDSIRRAKELAKRGIRFLDVGVSGGPTGALGGASLMVGGDRRAYEEREGLFADMAAPDGYGYMGEHGAGHFVKMVHNGIEYGMMQALAEGFGLMKHAPMKLDLKKIADVYNRGSVIESRLVGWLAAAFREFGEDLDGVGGSVAHTGEGAWAVKTAEKLKVPAPVMEEALKFRVRSADHASYIGKILSALRNQFGGHRVK